MLGIGYGFTYTLLNNDIKKLYILSLSQEVVDGALKAIAEELGQDKADRTKWIYCDLTDWESIPAIAKQITDDTDRIDILFNNAGRGVMTYQLTDYGVDRHMALVRHHTYPCLKALDNSERCALTEPHGTCHPYIAPVTYAQKDSCKW